MAHSRHTRPTGSDQDMLNALHCTIFTRLRPQIQRYVNSPPSDPELRAEQYVRLGADLKDQVISMLKALKVKSAGLEAQRMELLDHGKALLSMLDDVPQKCSRGALKTRWYHRR